MTSDCRAALLLLDRMEAMLGGGWRAAATVQAWTLARVLVLASGPQPELAAWLTDDARPLPDVPYARRELRAALERSDVMRAVAEAYGLARRLSLEFGEADVPGG